MESAGSSFSASSKRAKAPGNFTQVAQCLVDDCNADLSLCRDYHRRHKVCEAHSKHPKVTIGGRVQRFCQQCSRFHSLVEFDEGKRSCRKRLDGHNRRRRKPQPDRNSGLVFTSTQPSSRLLSFSSPQILPSSMLSSSWSGAAEIQYNNQMNYMDRQNAFPEGYRAVNQQLQLGDFLDPTRKMYSDSSDRALSLLSPALHQVAHPEPVHYSHHYPYHQGANPTHSNVPDSHVPGAFPSASEGSSAAAGSHQTLTFMWE